MCDGTLAIYCFIDDFLKQSGHREDLRVEVTDAEVITIAISAMLQRRAETLRKVGLSCTNSDWSSDFCPARAFRAASIACLI